MKPAGTEIAGHAVRVTCRHDRIQSMHVGIGTPATLDSHRIVYLNAPGRSCTCAAGFAWEPVWRSVRNAPPTPEKSG